MTFAGLDGVVAETSELAERFDAAGHRLFLVGGIVRDLYGDRDLAGDIDLDLTTDALPEQIKTIIGPMANSVWLQGERFGTIGARIGGRSYELTTHRAEVYLADSRKPSVAFSTAIEEDLSRRDFTVNAMAIELPSTTLIDPFGGAADLDASVLRTPLDPEVSFSDDPLRMIRAARFVAGNGLVPSTELVAAMESLADRLGIVSAERIRDELDKLLSVSNPMAGLNLLETTGLMARVVPEVDTARLGHREQAVRSLPGNATLRLAALLFGTDLGVVTTRLGELKHSNQRRRDTLNILRSAASLSEGEVVDAPSLRRWFAAAAGRADEARAIVSAVAEGGEVLAESSRRLEDSLGAELSDLSPALDGRAVMALLDLPSGAAVGRALDFLQALRYDEGPLEPAEAATRLQTWWGSDSA